MGKGPSGKHTVHTSGGRRSHGRRFARRFRRHFGGYAGGGAVADHSDFIEDIQSCLARLVGPWVPVTGRLGPATRRAIRNFQESHQLPVTGLLDHDTADAIKSACDGDSSGADAAGSGDTAVSANAAPAADGAAAAPSESEFWPRPPGFDWRRREGFGREGFGREGFGREGFGRERFGLGFHHGFGGGFRRF